MGARRDQQHFSNAIKISIVGHGDRQLQRCYWIGISMVDNRAGYEHFIG